MAPERPESAKTDFLVGLVLKRQKEKVDRLLSSSWLSREGWKETPATETVLPTSIRQKPYYRHQSVRNRTTVINPSPSADKSVQGLRLPRLQKERVEGGAARKYQSVYVPGDVINFATVASDVLNTFAGFGLFSVRKKYGDLEELENGSDYEDKYWLLTDLVATEDEISCNEEYCSTYCDSYFVVLNNRGNMTLVSPRYIELFHKIMFLIYRSLNVMKLVENRNKFMENAMDEVARNLPCWSKDLQCPAEGVHMVNP